MASPTLSTWIFIVFAKISFTSSLLRTIRERALPKCTSDSSPIYIYISGTTLEGHSRSSGNIFFFKVYLLCSFCWPSSSNNVISRSSLWEKNRKHFFQEPMVVWTNISKKWIYHWVNTNNMYHIVVVQKVLGNLIDWSRLPNKSWTDACSLDCHVNSPLAKLRGTAENWPVPPPWRKRTL